MWLNQEPIFAVPEVKELKVELLCSIVAEEEETRGGGEKTGGERSLPLRVTSSPHSAVSAGQQVSSAWRPGAGAERDGRDGRWVLCCIIYTCRTHFDNYVHLTTGWQGPLPWWAAGVLAVSWSWGGRDTGLSTRPLTHLTPTNVTVCYRTRQRQADNLTPPLITRRCGFLSLYLT